ncbi:AIM24 family protein [Brachybacterium sp. Marseille-Q2903]|uniref:AIM24 family protein n=1 Tax=Brachybacterium epidermidis TaxID=2781983 RepID=A0ABR9W2Y6_9MICO|nr:MULTISPECIES: AIM24 family protein [Brachybacterium]MBE9404810.1 AIM24 family protein [Brachybacterium epidermidis]MCT1775321.1 AIM24 family protein [Brachybacterium sp. p3-SID957]
MRSNLFDASNQEKQTNDRWTLQSSKMLRCALHPQAPEIISAAGAMVAYQGQMDFSYQGSGGGMKLLKKMVSGEGANMMRTRGHGEVFYARQAHEIFLIQLEGDALTLNTKNLLAFDSTIQWDIRALGGGGMMAGGLFNLFLQGQGMVAVTSDGPPMLLDCSRQPTYVDPQAAVCWSANLQPQIKNDFKMGSLIGRGSGESFQLAFHGPGFVVVQPSEGIPVVAAS